MICVNSLTAYTDDYHQVTGVCIENDGTVSE